jgi:hypothetical protein
VAQEGDWAHQWSMRGGGWVGEVAGERRRRRACGGASTPARIPASGGEVRANKRSWELPCVIGVMPSCLPGGVTGWKGVLAVAAAMAGGGAVCVRGGARVAFL